MLSVFAEFERAMIADRVRAGLQRARAQGRKLGRPPVSTEIVTRIRDQLQSGTGIHKTARLVGCGIGTVQRVRAELLASLPAA